MDRSKDEKPEFPQETVSSPSRREGARREQVELDNATPYSINPASSRFHIDGLHRP